MIAILEEQSLTEKVLSTTICLVEQTLNVGPLTAVSDDAVYLTALKPNHFLQGPENANAPFVPSSKHNHEEIKSLRTALANADLIWKNALKKIFPNGTKEVKRT